MLPLFDLMMQAQDGKAMEALARQFNLAQDQTAKAVAALMPAFSEGWKRHSSTPFDFASLMQKASSGNYAGYFEDLTRSFTPEGIADGNRALGEIFGSKEISSAIAAQAAKLTGIGQDILKQMMPAMADTMMGGLVKQMMGQVPGAFANPFATGMGGMTGGQAANPFAGAFATDGMGAMTQQWLESIGLARRKPDPVTAQMQAGLQAMMDNPFTRAMHSMFQPQAPGQKAESSASTDPFGIAPWLKSFQDMMTASSGNSKPEARPATPQAASAEGYGAFVNALFDSGLDVQKSYQASLEAILDQWTAKPGAR